ncbi:MAG TPA: hypothetical protein VI997_08485 [Candidatus Thermoplasmatota archaeon]|nr:hypothetical protein [Candidatus Thermoplasmatota archaeon]
MALRFDPVTAAALGATGVLPALNSVLQLSGPEVELVLWTALAAALWVPVVRARRSPPFATLLAAGVVAGVVTGALQASLAHVMFARNDEVAASFGGVVTLAIRLQLLLSSVVIGVVWGALVGGAALWFEKRRPLPRAA